MNQPPDSDNKLPVWVKAAHAAEPLGLSVDLFLSAVDQRQIPVRVEFFGRRGMAYANASDLTAYVRNLRHPAQAAA